jgi:predicted O-methyltransferase YrrM/lysophospholipase L1-like esterase
MVTRGIKMAEKLNPSSIPGWMSKEDFKVLEMLSSKIPSNARLVEIGTFCGRSAAKWASLLPEATIYTIDSNLDCVVTTEFLQQNAAEGDVHLYTGTIRNIVALVLQHYPNVVSIEARSTEIIALDNLDLVFIDGSHTYEAVLKDLEHWYPRLSPTGIISGHDYLPLSWPGVIKAVDEFATKNQLKVNLTPGSCVWFLSKPEGKSNVMPGAAIKYYPFNNYSGWNTMNLHSGRPPHLETTWHLTDTSSNLAKARKAKPSQMIYDEKSFTYKFNDHGYRCDDFKLADETNFKILFVGDSLTDGVGLPLDEVWARKMWRKINQTYGLNSPYWNLAQGGRSLDYIVRILDIAMQPLRPNLVLILTPDPFRQEWFGINDEAPCHTGPWLGEELSFLQDVYQESHIGYCYVKNLILLDLLMYKYKIEWFWGTWSLKPCRYQDSIPAEILARQWSIKFPSISELPTKAALARDGMHFGPATHTEFAEALFKELSPKLNTLCNR